jgi:benzodiazapine receptor
MSTGLAGFLRLAVCIVVCEMAGVIGSIFTASSVTTWYQTVSKPSFTPPDSIFAPVWITLYALMGVAVYLVWREGTGKPYVKVCLIVFAVQLVLNVLWSLAFFGLRSPLAGLVVIVALWIAILATVVVFHRISGWATFLLVPYLAWVSFAGLLNAAIYALNR